MQYFPSSRSVIFRLGALFVTLVATLATAISPLTVTASSVTTVDTFDTDQPVIALTFDVTFERGDGEMILDTLASKNVKATFGITGVWAQRNPDLIQRMVNEGHHLVNHSWDHPSYTGEYTGSQVYGVTDPLTPEQIADQLRRTEELIRQQVGIDMRPYARPPYGDHDASVLAAFAANGYTYNVMWTVDTLGWYGHSVDVIRQRTLGAARPGANILMHVGHGATDGLALPYVIDDLHARGYRFATVAQFVEDNLHYQRPQYFPQTDQHLGGNFLTYWNYFGGFAVFGYPITPEFEEDGVTVQYFERARFELHPGSWPERFDVHLGRLGSDLTRDRLDDAPFQPVDAESDRNCTYFPQTGHSLCHGFREYWERYGGVAVYGYPISQEFRELNPDTGETYVVQYFERQRFEWHPGEWPARYDVMLGRLGAQSLN